MCSERKPQETGVALKPFKFQSNDKFPRVQRDSKKPIGPHATLQFLPWFVFDKYTEKEFRNRRYLATKEQLVVPEET